MRRWEQNEDHAGLIAIRLTGNHDQEKARLTVSAALEPFAAEPLDWDSGRTTLARLRREGVDPTTSLRILAIEQTIAAAAAIRDEIAAGQGSVALACDVERIGVEPTDPEYWVRRWRLHQLAHFGDDQTLCRRDLAAARAVALDRLRVHFEPANDPSESLRLVAGKAKGLTVDIERWVTPYIENKDVPFEHWVRDGVLDAAAVDDRRDLARYVGPTAATRVILVLADAWVGKTFVARRLESTLRDGGFRVHATSFETAAPDLPSDEFLNASEPRFWIVDASDEAERRGVSFGRLKGALRASALTTVVFGRPDASLPALETCLGFREDGSPSSVERKKLRLLWLDKDQARRELVPVVGPDRADTILRKAAAFGNVPLAFEELRELGQSEGTESVSTLHALRRRVALRRSTVSRLGSKLAPGHSPDDLFRVAQLLAAVAALGAEPRFHFGALARGFYVNALVPEELRSAADALRETTALIGIGDGGYSFSAAHLEEDLAALFITDAVQNDRLTKPALRTILTDGRGPRPELERIVQRVREGLQRNQKDTAILEDVLSPAFDPGMAVQRFEALLQNARTAKGSWGLAVLPLERLGTDGVRAKIAHLLEGEQKEPVRILALRIALANSHREGWSVLASQAARLALSSSESPYVRTFALVLAADEPETLDQLRPILETISRDQPDELLAQLRARLVLELLRAGRLSPLHAVRACPAGRAHLIDSRHLAVAELGRRMDAQTARVVLDELAAQSPRTIDPSVLYELRTPAAAAFLRSAGDPAGEDARRLVFILASPEMFADVAKSGRPLSASLNAAQRRAAYRLSVLEGKESFILSVSEDAEWLIEEAPSFGEALQRVTTDLYASVLSLERRKQAPELAKKGRELLRNAGVWDAFEERRKREEEWSESTRKTWEKARQKLIDDARSTALPIESMVDTVLGDRRDPSLRLHVLGDFFFCDRSNAINVVGSVDDLPQVQREAVMYATRNALEQASPLSVPSGNTFSSSLLHEGMAFIAAVLWRKDWLESSLVERWLPVALFVATDVRSRIAEVLERCFEVDPETTVAAVTRDIARRARQRYTNPERIPNRLWFDSRFREGVTNLIRELAIGDEQQRQAMGEVLDALFERSETSIAPAMIRSLLEILLGNSSADVRRAAVGAWFRRWPEEGVDPALDATATLEDAISIFDPRRSWERRERPLSDRVLARVAQRLLPPLVPPTASSLEAHWVSPVEMLQEWRDGLVRQCVERFEAADEPGAELQAAIQAIERDEVHGAWLSNARARQAMANVLDAPPWPVPSPEKVAQILEGALGLVHDVAGLAALVSDILERKDWDAADISLLYDDGGKRRRESYLHVLVRNALREGLAKISPPIVLSWEPKERGSNIPDFLVARSKRGHLMEVPIEVKWSDNDPVVGLEAQLGDRYLGEHRRTHGVFLVGWTGEQNLETLDRRLEEARKRQVEKGRTIFIVRKDLQRR